LEAGHIEPGSHVNAVGSSTASMRELSPELVARTRIIVDTVEGARNESGDIIAAMRSGALTPQADLIRLCDVVSGKAAGRKSDDEITLFKSLGMALEDVACAALALRRARERGTGLTVEF
jgi:ornithine cyclodeaminase/alanine dehydrogenase-like protein (mu-crystallin family)